MNSDDNNNFKKSNQFSNEVISPIFGHDYQNRVVAVKKQKIDESETDETINYLEKQIEEELDAKTKLAKAKEYQESLKTDTDVLKQYHKHKEDEEMKAALPSNYLNFRDSLEKTSDSSSISDFNETIFDVNDITANIDSNLTITNTISEIIEDIFDQVENN